MEDIIDRLQKATTFEICAVVSCNSLLPLAELLCLSLQVTASFLRWTYWWLVPSRGMIALSGDLVESDKVGNVLADCLEILLPITHEREGGRRWK